MDAAIIHIFCNAFMSFDTAVFTTHWVTIVCHHKSPVSLMKNLKKAEN